ncbi:MAG: zinc ribbon domain-containing protein, partial [Thermotogota bacterium]|nr:zinc ribbon domain-containing protein [Thermotogota bacterium]
MPLYKYKCKNCGYEFTVLHSMSETPEVKCELCGSETEKMI